MRVKPELFGQKLQQDLAPVYLISGDEPFQQGEVADSVRAVARQNGYDVREIFSEETGISWSALTSSISALSIFSDKKIIDLRLPSAAPGAEGSKALVAYCERLPGDTLLLITSGKLSSDAMKSRWYQAIDKAGVIVQVWPLLGQDLLSWLQRRSQRRGLSFDQAGLSHLASRVEGNLLAAAQEIEKLYVLYGSGQISQQQVDEAVADSARYDVYQLVDASLTSDVNRLLKIFHGLHAENLAGPIVLWALARETRMLMKMKKALETGQRREWVLADFKIRENRKTLVGSALLQLDLSEFTKILTLCALADRQIKGQESGDAWETLLQVCLLLGRVKVISG